MDQVGITRIFIESDWDDWRTRMSRELSLYANIYLRDIFKNIGMELNPGEEVVKCKKDEATARYDHKEGIDVILNFKSGFKGTLQEKYLTYNKSTATFELKKNSGALGAHSYCTAQYYWVAYFRRWLPFKDAYCHDWILLNLPKFHHIESTQKLPFHYNKNNKDGRYNPFKWIYFDDIPEDAIIIRKQGPDTYQGELI